MAIRIIRPQNPNPDKPRRPNPHADKPSLRKIIRAIGNARRADIKDPRAKTHPSARHSIDLPREPDYDPVKEPKLYDEQQVSRVEMIMMRGIRDRLKIATNLHISSQKADEYIRRVKARWEIEGNEKRLTEYRGEALSRLRTIEGILWERYDSEVAETRLQRGADGLLHPVAMKMKLQDFLAMMREIREVSQHRTEMLGLTKDMVERLMETEEQSGNFNRKQEVFERGTRVMSRVLDMIEAARKPMKVIDHVQD